MRKRTCKTAAHYAGAPTYNDHAPCRRGHFSDRITRDGSCIACRVEQSNTKRKPREKRPTDQVRESVLYVGRAMAIVQGATTYINNKPCEHCHTTFRYSVSGNCVECMRELFAKVI